MKLKILEIREASNTVVSSSNAVVDIMVEEAKADRECFWILHLNAANRIIEKELVSMGTVNSSLIHPREVFKKAILNGSTGIITVHNHPGGQAKPSNEDKTLWERLDDVGKLLGIEVLDHLIVTPSGEYFSKNEERI